MFKYLKKKKKEETKRTEKSKNLKDVKKTEVLNDLAYLHLNNPHITEKATLLSKYDQYLFRVKNDSNKIQIKEAVESLYEVDILGINIIKIPAKKKRIGKKIGSKKGYKKAIIKIEKGKKIEFN